MENIVQIVKKPLLTEKASRNNEQTMSLKTPVSQVVFEVEKTANKAQIKRAVEKLFSVKVADVRTCILPSKRRRVGRFVGVRPAWKKAIVTLVSGQKIDFFEGV